MNNFISYAPLLTIYTLWSFRLGGLNTADNSEVHSDGDEWVEQIPESLRKQYTPFLCRMRLLVYRQMALSSLPGLVLMGPTYLRTRMDMQKCVQTGAICGGPMSREEKSHAQEINILATGFDAINREPDLARNLGVPA